MASWKDKKRITLAHTYIHTAHTFHPDKEHCQGANLHAHSRLLSVWSALFEGEDLPYAARISESIQPWGHSWGAGSHASFTWMNSFLRRSCHDATVYYTVKFVSRPASKRTIPVTIFIQCHQWFQILIISAANQTYQWRPWGQTFEIPHALAKVSRPRATVTVTVTVTVYLC
jgi:hypothetical protein